MIKKKCSNNRCESKAITRGYCGMHYARLKRRGEMPNIEVTNKERFENKCEPISESGCIIWMGATDKDGYGQSHIKSNSMGAHRVSWVMNYGEIPDGLCVLHKCDVRSCVNPEHLFLGTNSDNSDDMVKKGRSARGESSSKTIFSEKDALRIKFSDEKNVILAKKYNVTPAAISSIKLGKNWKYLNKENSIG